MTTSNGQPTTKRPRKQGVVGKTAAGGCYDAFVRAPHLFGFVGDG
jgi:hypothetical protein